MSKQKEKLLKYYDLTIQGLIKYSQETFGHWTEDSWFPNSSITFDNEDVGEWLNQTFNYAKREALYELQPDYYGDYNTPYPFELVDEINRRLLYISNCDRGASITYNVFISAPQNKVIPLGVLMNQTFLAIDQLGEILNKGNKTMISIHPFKLKEDDIPTIGILFSYKEPNH